MVAVVVVVNESRCGGEAKMQQVPPVTILVPKNSRQSPPAGSSVKMQNHQASQVHPECAAGGNAGIQVRQ